MEYIKFILKDELERERRRLDSDIGKAEGWEKDFKELTEIISSRISGIKEIENFLEGNAPIERTYSIKIEGYDECLKKVEYLTSQIKTMKDMGVSVDCLPENKT